MVSLQSLLLQLLLLLLSSLRVCFWAMCYHLKQTDKKQQKRLRGRGGAFARLC